VVVTELLSPSSFTIESESCLNVEKLLRLLRMWCDTLESMTHFGVVAEKAQALSQKGSQSPVVARAVVAVAFFTFHHSCRCF
jgi:hypothetical protein